MEDNIGIYFARLGFGIGYVMQGIKGMVHVNDKISRFFAGLSERITYRHWVILAALASAALGLLVFAGLSSPLGGDEKPAQVDMVHVVVAKQDIAPKTIIKESMVELREMPASVVSDDAARSVGDIVNKPAKVQIMKDDIVTTRKVLMDITMAGFTGEIPPECRAISIAITDVTGVAGFAKPGDYVDIMLIAKGDEKMTGRIVLQDVLLLAINKTTNAKQNAGAANGDTKKTGDGSDSKSKDSSKDESANKAAIGDLATATLAVLPEDALKLITEAQEGTLYLALRPYKPRDKFTTDTKYIHYSTTKASKPSTPAPAPTQSAPAPVRQPAMQQPASAAPMPSTPARSGGVEVIRGTESTREGT